MSQAPSTPIKSLASLLPNLVLLLGVIFAFSSVISYSNSKEPVILTKTDSSKLIADASLLTERQIAVTQAQKNGQKSYSFSSNYTPGIGRVSDPSAYEQSWVTKTKKTIPDLNNAQAIGNFLVNK